MASSRYEKIVLAFSTDAKSGCTGTIFHVVNEADNQYYKLRMQDRDSLRFEFKLLPLQPAVEVRIDVTNINLCDTTRHIVNIERTFDNKIKYRIDGRKVVEKEYRIKADALFLKPYNYYVGNTKADDDAFVGCISGAKFHLFTLNGNMMSVEPIKVGVRSNSSCKYCCAVCIFPHTMRESNLLKSS